MPCPYMRGHPSHQQIRLQQVMVFMVSCRPYKICRLCNNGHMFNLAVFWGIICHRHTPSKVFPSRHIPSHALRCYTTHKYEICHNPECRTKTLRHVPPPPSIPTPVEVQQQSSVMIPGSPLQPPGLYRQTIVSST